MEAQYSLIRRKRLLTIISIVALILLIPLVAMQFTKEVNWSFGDFAIAAILLTTTGLLFDFTLRKWKKSRYRNLYLVLLFAALLLIWAELAVGIFGTPFAGS